MKTIRDYKTTVLDILKEHPNEDISRDSLMSMTNISKSRLTEILQSIRADGYNIITPARSGKVRLDINLETDTLPLSTIKDYDIRQWLILFLLSKYGQLTFRELLIKTMTLKDYGLNQMSILVDPDSNKKSYDNNDLIKSIRKNSYGSDNEDFLVSKDVISVTALRNDLNFLRKLGLVTMKKAEHTTYQLTSQAPYIITISGDSLYEFCQKYEATVSTTTELEPLKNAYGKIRNLINVDEASKEIRRFGKTNEISQSQIDTFNNFIQHPYKTNLIQLSRNDSEYEKVETFAVGLIFYSVETGFFYLLGRNLTEERIESRRLDWIKKVTPLPDANNEYHQDYYYQIYQEMFSAHYEDQVHHVKVYFQDFGNVTKRFFDLNSIRPLSNIRLIDNPPNDCPYRYVYEDEMRGLTDFSRYLRGFGMSVLAAEPQELQDKMLFSYNRIIEKYGEEDE